MNKEQEYDTEFPDPAAVFACALSLWQACHKCEAVEPSLNLSAANHKFVPSF